MTPRPGARRWFAWLPTALLVNPRRVAFPMGFAGNVGWQYGATAAAIGGNLVYMLLVANGLGPTDYGLMALTLSWATIVFGALDLRLHEAVIRYLSEFEQTHDAPRMHAFARASAVADLLIKVPALTALVALSPWIAGMITGVTRADAVVVAAATAVFFQTSLVSTSTGLLRVLDRFKSYTLVKIGGMGIQIVGALIALERGWGAAEILQALAVSNLLTSAALGALAFQALHLQAPLRGRHAPFRLLRDRAREIAGFTSSTYGLSVAALPARDLDVIVLGWNASLADVGAYRIAKNILSGAWAVSDPVFFALYPVVARLWTRRQFMRLARFLEQLVWVLSGGGVVLFVFLFFLIPPMVSWATVEGYEAVGSSLRWMSWAVLGWMPLLWVHAVVCAAGRPSYSLVGAIVANGLAAAGYFLLIPSFGVRGAAFCHALGVVLAPATAAAIAWQRSILPSGRARRRRVATESEG